MVHVIVAVCWCFLSLFHNVFLTPDFPTFRWSFQYIDDSGSQILFVPNRMICGRVSHVSKRGFKFPLGSPCMCLLGFFHKMFDPCITFLHKNTWVAAACFVASSESVGTNCSCKEQIRPIRTRIGFRMISNSLRSTAHCIHSPRIQSFPLQLANVSDDSFDCV